MTIESRLRDLYARIRELSERLHEARTTIREDHPTPGDTVLVDIVGDAVDDVIGWLAEAQDGALQAQQALTYPARFDLVRQALARSHQQAIVVSRRYAIDLGGYDRLAELLRMARERGPEWRAWAHGVKQGLDRCQAPLADVHQALLECWLELAEDRFAPRSEMAHAAPVTPPVSQS